MDTDLVLVLGLVFCVLSIPSLLNAYTEGHVPRVGTLLAVGGVILFVLAISQRPTGYAFAEIPDVFIRVFARYLN
jgi:hypothetical protein